MKVLTTRFNTITWDENQCWRERNNWKGCIYPRPCKITCSISKNKPLFVIEMQNDTNTILGFGLISNKLKYEKQYKIYENENYNRYTYHSDYRIDITEIYDKHKDFIDKLSQAIFKGKGHLKRGQGLTQLPKKIDLKIKLNVAKYIKNLFKETNK